MKVFWKYHLSLQSETDLDLFVGARILSVHGQGFQIVLWALVDTDAELKPKTFYTLRTGNLIPSDFDLEHSKYLGAVELTGSVWHVFEKGATDNG